MKIRVWKNGALLFYPAKDLVRYTQYSDNSLEIWYVENGKEKLLTFNNGEYTAVEIVKE